MNRSISMVFKIVPLFCIAVAAILWILDIAGEINGFKFGHFASVACLSIGLSMFIHGMVDKYPVTRRGRIVGGSIIFACGLICLVFAFAMKKNMIIPIIILCFAIAAILAVLFNNGGKKWDEADNQKPEYQGYKPEYKSYAQQMAEKEAAKKAKEAANAPVAEEAKTEAVEEKAE